MPVPINLIIEWESPSYSWGMSREHGVGWGGTEVGDKARLDRMRGGLKTRLRSLDFFHWVNGIP